MVLIKKRTFFVQNVSVDNWTAILSKLSKVATKPSYKICSRSEFEKNLTIFQKQCFFKNHAPPDNWIAVLKILPKRFYHFSGINFCIDPKKNVISLKWIFLKWNFSSGDLGSFHKIPAGNFSLAVRKKFCN